RNGGEGGGGPPPGLVRGGGGGGGCRAGRARPPGGARPRPPTQRPDRPGRPPPSPRPRPLPNRRLPPRPPSRRPPQRPSPLLPPTGPPLRRSLHEGEPRGRYYPGYVKEERHWLPGGNKGDHSVRGVPEAAADARPAGHARGAWHAQEGGLPGRRRGGSVGPAKTRALQDPAGSLGQEALER